MRWSALFLCLVALSCPSPVDEDLSTLVEWMTGSFSSEQQAAIDEGYRDIRLEMVRIWKDRTDGYWLYVEQAAATHLDRPYRQRVYHVTRQEDGSFRSEVYALPEPLRLAGEWRREQPLEELSPDELEVRTGCAVILLRQSEAVYAGETSGAGCTSTLRGASYATSVVEIRPDRITSWDRGFAGSGEQVWGAEMGPYVFLRKDSEPGGQGESR
jgi:hypothetical protein